MAKFIVPVATCAHRILLSQASRFANDSSILAEQLEKTLIMNLRTTILRGALGVFALALFASVQAQTITFDADFYPSELDVCIVTFNGDTIFNETDHNLVFPGGANSTSDFNVVTYGAGDYTVTMSDDYGDGGSGFFVDAGDFNCVGTCSAALANCGGFGNYCLETWAFTLTADVPGCTDENALNYDMDATLDDGSCLLDLCPDSAVTMVFINMFDSYGDGWNGNTYELYNNGSFVTSGNLDSSVTAFDEGFPGGPIEGQDTICLTPGCYELVSGGGAFVTQISISVVNAYTGEQIAFSQDGGSSAFYFGTEAEVCGCTDVTALNYDGTATLDNGTCFYPECADGESLVTFMMYDTFGDGWDGTTYTFQNLAGEVVASGSLDDAQFTVSAGDQGYDLICLSNSDCYTLELAGGFYQGEKEWQIIDYATGDILYAQMNNNGFGTFGVAGPGVACGCTNSDAFNYVADATTDDGSCLLPSCSGNADSTSYLLNLTHNQFLNWGNNAAIIYDAATGDTILAGGYVNNLYPPDYETSPGDGYWEFCVPNDACLAFSGGGGSTTGIAQWSIIDFEGNEIHAGGLGMYDIGFGASVGACVSGCTLTAAINFDEDATVDDGSCVVCDNGQLALYLTLQDNSGNGWSNDDYYYVVSEETGDTVLTGTMPAGPSTITSINCLDIGCYTFNTDPIFTSEGWGLADNLGNEYAPLTFGTADGVQMAFGGTDVTDCEFPGCTDPAANNYNNSASVDDGTCEFPPANDDWQSAQAIACDLIVSGSLENANGDEYNGTTVLGNPISQRGAIWYEFNADQDYQVTFDLCASQNADNGVTDTDVIVFVDNGDGTLTPVATNDDSGVSGCGAGNGYNSIVSINAEQGNNYLLRVSTWSSFNTQTGIVVETICAACDFGFPVNDDVCDVVLPLVNGGSYDGSTCCANPDDDFGLANLSFFATTYGVWYQLEVDTNYNLYNLTVAATGDGAVGYGVYSGADCTDLNDQQSGSVLGALEEPMPQFFGTDQEEPATVSITNPEASQNYYLFLWTTQSEGCGSFNVSVAAEVLGCTDSTASNYDADATVNSGCLYIGVTQPNDSCDNAIAVACGETISGNTGGATAAGGVDPCGGDDPGVWYTFNNGGVEQLVTITTCGSTVNTEFALFQEYSTPDAFLSVMSFDEDNYQNISAAIVSPNGDTIEVAAGDVFPTPFSDYYLPLTGGDYTVLFTNNGTESDGIYAQVISSNGDLSQLCSGDCTMDAYVDLEADETVELSFTMFGGTGLCSSILCYDQGDNTVISSEGCDNGETLQFISDANANNYSILVSAGNGSIGGPFDLSVSCEPVVYGCQQAGACNYNADANVDDPNDPCEYTSCLGCETETWNYCYDNNEDWSFTLNNINGGGAIVIDLAGTLIEQGWDELVIDDAATGANLYNSDVDADDSLVFATDSVTVSFTSDGSVSCVSSTTPYSISMAITCAVAPTTGCADSTACNYNGPVDFEDNTLCDYSCLGCTDSDATNYNPFASVDDGSCCFGAPVELVIEGSTSIFSPWEVTYAFLNAAGDTVLSGMTDNTAGGTQLIDICLDEPGCYDFVIEDGFGFGFFGWEMEDAFNTSSGNTGTFQVGIGSGCVEGCDLPFALNYQSPDSIDIVNNDLCDFTGYVMGCTYVNAENYDEIATNDDGSCIFNVANPCPTDLNADGQTTTSDLLIFLGAFGTECEE